MNYFCQLILLLNLFLVLFISPTVLLVLFIDPTILFQLNFTFIYSTFNKKVFNFSKISESQSDPTYDKQKRSTCICCIWQVKKISLIYLRRMLNKDKNNLSEKVKKNLKQYLQNWKVDINWKKKDKNCVRKK